MSTVAKRLARRYIISGIIGILAALLAYSLGSISAVGTNEVFNPYILFTLAPGMILGIADPQSRAGILVLLGIVFGTNFVLYGTVGLLLWEGWSWYRVTWLIG
jgi:hypothetical protein